MLPCRSFGIRMGRSRRERGVRKAQRTLIPTQKSQLPEHPGVGTAQQQAREQRIFPCPGDVDFIDAWDHTYRNYLGKAPPGGRLAGEPGLASVALSEELSAGAAATCRTSSLAEVGGSASPGLSRNPSTALFKPTRARVSRARAYSATASGPKPGMAAGSLKSHWFSPIPMKSRMAGSAAQALRSAARVNSAGTPSARNGRISLSATIDSIDGKPATSKAAAGDISGPATVSTVPDSRFNRDQRG